MYKIEEIKKLAELLKEGAISQEEYNSLKETVLSAIDNTILSISDSQNKKVIEDNSIKNEALKMLEKEGITCSQQNLVTYSSKGDFRIVELLLIAGLNPNNPYINENKLFGIGA